MSSRETHDVVARLRASGCTITLDATGQRVRATRPLHTAAIQPAPEDLAWLRGHHGDVLAYLKAPASVLVARADKSRPVEPVGAQSAPESLYGPRDMSDMSARQVHDGYARLGVSFVLDRSTRELRAITPLEWWREPGATHAGQGGLDVFDTRVIRHHAAGIAEILR